MGDLVTFFLFLDIFPSSHMTIQSLHALDRKILPPNLSVDLIVYIDVHR